MIDSCPVVKNSKGVAYYENDGKDSILNGVNIVKLQATDIQHMIISEECKKIHHGSIKSFSVEKGKFFITS